MTTQIKEPEFGSEAWVTHMRRSLAQRKRHGENITDIEGLIKYIKNKGPAQGKGKSVGNKTSGIKNKSRRNTINIQKRTGIQGKNITQPSQARPQSKGLGDGLYSAPSIVKVK